MVLTAHNRVGLLATAVFELPRSLLEMGTRTQSLAHAIETLEPDEGQLWCHRLAPMAVRCQLPRRHRSGETNTIHIIGTVDLRLAATDDGLGAYTATLMVKERIGGPRPLSDEEWTELIERPGQAICTSGWRGQASAVGSAFVYVPAEQDRFELALPEAVSRGSAAIQTILADAAPLDRRPTRSMVRGTAFVAASSEHQRTTTRSRSSGRSTSVVIERHVPAEADMGEAIDDARHLLERRARGEWLLRIAEQQVGNLERQCDPLLTSPISDSGLLADVLATRRALKRRFLVGIAALEADDDDTSARPFEAAWRSRTSQLRGRLDTVDELIDDLALLLQARIARSLSEVAHDASPVDEPGS